METSSKLSGSHLVAWLCLMSLFFMNPDGKRVENCFNELPLHVLKRIMESLNRLDTENIVRFVNTILFFVENRNIFPSYSWIIMMCDYVDMCPGWLNTFEFMITVGNPTVNVRMMVALHNELIGAGMIASPFPRNSV